MRNAPHITRSRNSAFRIPHSAKNIELNMTTTMADTVDMDDDGRRLGHRRRLPTAG